MNDSQKYRNFLGKEIEVIVDRPLGSVHPEYETVYEINYGYVPETIAGDGREIDAYILGVAVPIERYRGVCIAVVYRRNDVEHKLVAAAHPLPMDEIRKQTQFIEQYYETQIEVIDGYG